MSDSRVDQSRQFGIEMVRKDDLREERREPKYKYQKTGIGSRRFTIGTWSRIESRGVTEPNIAGYMTLRPDIPMVRI